MLRMCYVFQKSCQWASGVTHLDPSVLQEIVEVVAGQSASSRCVGEMDPERALVVCVTVGCQPWVSRRPPWITNVWWECSVLLKSTAFWMPECCPPVLHVN